MGLKGAVLVAYWWVYLAPCLLCFVGVVVDALLDEDVRRPVLWGTLPVCHGFGCLGEHRDGGRQCGFADLGYHAGVCWEVPVCCEHPWLWALWVSGGVREIALLIWATASGCIMVG